MYDGFKYTIVFINAYNERPTGVIARCAGKPWQSFCDISVSNLWQVTDFSGQSLGGQMGAPVAFSGKSPTTVARCFFQVILCGSGSGDSGLSAVAQLPCL